MTANGDNTPFKTARRSPNRLARAVLFSEEIRAVRKKKPEGRTQADRMADPKREWIILHCLDAWRDANGKPGQHKVPLEGYDRPMSYAEAWAALEKIETERPNEDFSIRRVAEVFPLRR